MVGPGQTLPPKKIEGDILESLEGSKGLECEKGKLNKRTRT